MIRFYLFVLLSLFTAANAFGQRLALEPFADGFEIPVSIAHANDDRLFIVEKRGYIKAIWLNGDVIEGDFLDISDRVNSSANERGLLGLAFHPDFFSNGHFFVNYTRSSGTTVVSRFTIDDDGVGDPNSEMVIIEIPQPFSNHNGGCILFGPDGYLYIAMGDGGAGGDPQNHGQNPMSLLGKMLRLDIDNGTPYSIPEDNPFADDDFTADEIWATGLRNPWRFSFDKETGDMWIADVGQDEFEEIDFQPADSRGGENYGWKCWEGNDQFSTSGCGDPESYTYPIYTYQTSASNLGCSVTGGYVYRGQAYPGLLGYYVFADYCTGQLWTIKNNDCDGFRTSIDIRGDFQSYSAFGEDSLGELYLAGAATGEIFKVTSQCQMALTAESTNANCLEGILGTATVNISGSDNFEISWDNGVTGLVNENLSEGCYCASVFDSNTGCSERVCVEINDTSNFDLGDPINVIGCGVGTIGFDNPYPDFDIRLFLNGDLLEDEMGPFIGLEQTGTYTIQFFNDQCESEIILIGSVEIIEVPQPIITQGFNPAILIASDGYESYHWYLDGTLLTTTTENMLEVTMDGLYTVVVEDILGCQSEPSEGFLFETSNVLDHETVTAFNLYPNPFENEIRINLSLSKQENIKLELFDMAGKQVFNQDLGSSNNFDHLISTRDFPSGVYMLKVQIDGQNYVEQLIKH